MLYSPILSFFRILPLFFWALFCLPLNFIFFFFSKEKFFFFYRLFFKGLVKIFGIRISQKGKKKNNKVLYVSNHVSYLDIFLLGSLLDGLFVAKSEIKSWPLINKLCELGRTIFVDRKGSLKAFDQINVLNSNLEKGFNIILFPEGTSSDGTRVLPFKSALFGIVDAQKSENWSIQPISLTYRKLDGVPVDKNFRPFFAWFGAMDLIPHAWKFLGLGVSEVRINFHKARKFSSFKDRKQACKYSFDCISEQVQNDYSSVEAENKINLYQFKYL